MNTLLFSDRHPLFLRMQDEVRKSLSTENINSIKKIVDAFICNHAGGCLKAANTNQNMMILYGNKARNSLNSLKSNIIKKLSLIKETFPTTNEASAEFLKQINSVLFYVKLARKSIKENFIDQTTPEYRKKLKALEIALSAYDPERLLLAHKKVLAELKQFPSLNAIKKHKEIVKNIHEHRYPYPAVTKPQNTISGPFMLPLPLAEPMDINNLPYDNGDKEECCSINPIKNLCTIS